jgi:membrane peptidoglycan carboxypeptidase
MSSLLIRRRLRERRRTSRRARPILIAFLGLVAFGAVMAAAGLGALFTVYHSYARDYVPIEEKLLEVSRAPTEIYDRGGPENGVLLASLSNPNAQLLNPVALEDISPWLIEAIVSTEDNAFWSHPGFNLRGLLRAAYENYVAGDFGAGSGGSSITQQLIKNVYICPSVAEDGDVRSACITPERTIDRKLREIVYAIELEQDYTKEQILTWYLNQISFGDRYIGVEAAAQGYFRKSAKELTLAEAALLAGLPQAPTLYHPRLNCIKDDQGACIVDEYGRGIVGGAAKARQEDVLNLMVRHERLTPEQAAAAKAEEVRVYLSSNPQRAEAFVYNQVEPRLVRMCEAGILPKLPSAIDCRASVRMAGYQVTSTLDWELTAQAKEMARSFISAGLEAGCDCHNAAIITIEPSTGQIIVYAANRDPSYRSDRRVAGEIDQLNEINQPGSAFKPAVYLAWFNERKTAPMSILWDTHPLKVEGTSIENPRRDADKTEGLISAHVALGSSQNIPAFRAAEEAGIDNVIRVAQALGFTTLAQRFDPTFRSHPDVIYGPSIATGGANIRAIDMAYMNAVFANMGRMVGVPTLARYVQVSDLKSTALDIGADYELALEQRLQFARGHIRIEGTRELDPVVILEVHDKDGNLIFRQGEPETRQVVDAGSAWLLHTVSSDCTNRFIIWSCGRNNDDLGLDFFANGQRIPAGVKTGTQQGPLSAADTLENWMTGYSRHAATAVWVGNATNELVNDRQFASARTATRLYKNWMGFYHETLTARGVADVGKGFEDLQPRNVARREFQTPATDRNLGPDFKFCDQVVTAWVRTDVTYESQCEEIEIDSRNGLLATEQTPAEFRRLEKFVRLPTFKPELAVELAEKRNIPIAPKERSTGLAAIGISNLTTGRTITSDTDVLGTVNPPNLKNWRLELGKSSTPSEWVTLGEGSARIDHGILGTIRVAGLEDGVYTLRLSTNDGRGLAQLVYINIRASGLPSPFATPTPFRGGRENQVTATPTPFGGGREDQVAATPTPTPDPDPDSDP